MPPEILEAASPDVEISSGTDTSTETSVETGETGENLSETGNQLDSTPENQGLTDKTGKTGKLDLTKVVKTQSEALKAIDPALPAAIRTAAFELSGLYREFPGGLKEAVAAKAALGEIGGAEGIKEYTEALADYGSLETLFEKGDPQFIERLADSLPSSFSQIMPAGLEKWKKTDPEIYNHVQARVMMQTLDASRVSDTLASIWQQTEKPELKEAIASVWNLLDGFRKAGEKAPERKTSPQDEALTKREQQLAERESRALIAPVATEGRQQLQTITDREMAASYKWAETDQSVKDAVTERVRTEVINASSKDKAFTREFDRLKERSDAAGLSRHVKNFQDRVTPAIVQRVARLFAVKPKGAGTVVPKKAPIAANGTAKPEQGWQRISAQPTAAQMDRSKTTADMILDNKAILKDGRKVAWA